MAYALLGTIGTAVQGASGASVSPAWGAGETPTVNLNLGILWVVSQGSATFPSTPSGWNLARHFAGTSNSVNIFFKILGPGTAAPTVALVTGAVLTAQLAEFSGNNARAGAIPDATGASSTTSSTTMSATASTVDLAPGGLIVTASGAFYSAPAAHTLTDSYNNGAAVNATNNNGTSTQFCYSLGWGITTSNAVASADSWSTDSTTNLTGAAVAIATIPLPALDTTALIRDQAPVRASFY